MAEAKRKFIDSFWGTNYISFEGFERLHQRMKDAKQFTDDFAAYIKQRSGERFRVRVGCERGHSTHVCASSPRAAIEEIYAKSLIKLGKSAGGQSETGTLRQSWDSMKAGELMRKLGDTRGEE